VSYELALMPDRAAAAALEEKIYAGPVFIGLLLPMLTLSVIGTIGAGVALWRAGHAPAWAAACLGLAIVSDFVAPERFPGVPMFALLMVGFLGLRVSGKRTTDAGADRAAAWQGPPVGSTSGAAAYSGKGR